MPAYGYGIVGLGVMGRSLVQNLVSQGFDAVGHSYSAEEIDQFKQQHPEIRVEDTLRKFADAVTAPRIILLMVTAGDAVDSVIKDLLPLLEAGDVLIDGGNSLYTDTIARQQALAGTGIEFLGTGISGGEQGALHGASIMVGGNYTAYESAENMLSAIAAETRGVRCVGWMGEGGAGHFVKMVHNGIEYAMMQLIAETWDIMISSLGMTVAETQRCFESWRDGPLASYLIDITADILAQKDDLTEGMLVQMIVDQAGQKGTGRWTVLAGMELDCPIPTINASVSERQLSAQKPLRKKVSASSGLSRNQAGATLSPAALSAGLYGSIISAYAQGLALISAAAEFYGWKTDLAAVVSLWRGGCIIRAEMLEDFLQVFQQDSAPEHLLLSAAMTDKIKHTLPGWQNCVQTAVGSGVPVPAMSASLAYVYSLTSSQLPTSLIQAQRDYFGAHTYQRHDREGVFHTQWQREDQ